MAAVIAPQRIVARLLLLASPTELIQRKAHEKPRRDYSAYDHLSYQHSMWWRINYAWYRRMVHRLPYISACDYVTCARCSTEESVCVIVCNWCMRAQHNERGNYFTWLVWREYGNNSNLTIPYTSWSLSNMKTMPATCKTVECSASSATECGAAWHIVIVNATEQNFEIYYKQISFRRRCERSLA